MAAVVSGITDTDTIHIVLACDTNYARHAAVVMSSIMATTKKSLWFHILGENIAPDVAAKLQVLVSAQGAQLTIYSPQLPDEMYVSDHISKAAYFRLLIGSPLPESVHRVIYLDTDLVAMADINELWSVDLGSNIVGAVPDLGVLCSSKSMASKRSELQLASDALYFNSGVMLIDVDKWRSEDIGAKTLADANSHEYRHHDQDALNHVLKGKWLPLPFRWNVIPPLFFGHFSVLWGRFGAEAKDALRHIGIFHWAGRKKPWQYALFELFNGQYYQYSDGEVAKKELPWHKKMQMRMVRMIVGE